MKLSRKASQRLGWWCKAPASPCGCGFQLPGGESTKSARVAAGQDPNHHMPDDDEFEVVEELVEEVISEKEELVKEKKK